MEREMTSAMREIPIGAWGVYPSRRTALLANSFKDSILPPVFATPYLVLVMENAASNAIKQYLKPGESAVGTRVDVLGGPFPDVPDRTEPVHRLFETSSGSKQIRVGYRCSSDGG